MFGSTVLEVAISLILVYLMLSLMCSACTEWVAKRLSLRATTLEAGLRSLLTDPNELESITTALYNHPLIKGLVPPVEYAPAQGHSLRNLIVNLTVLLSGHPLLDRGIEGESRLQRIKRVWSLLLGAPLPNTIPIGPSYIPARNFALALMDVVAPINAIGSTVLDQLAQGSGSAPNTDRGGGPIPSTDGVGGILNAGLQKSLATLANDAQGDLIRTRQNIEQWFDDSMTRVSGWYKRDVQWFTLFFAFVVTLALNADTLVIANTFWHDDATREAAVSFAQQVITSPATSTDADLAKRVTDVQQQLRNLGLPLGWQADAAFVYSTNFYSAPACVALLMWLFAKLAGLWLTTLAVSMGAPFWFDMLNKLVSLRASGKPPTPAAETLRVDVSATPASAPANGVTSLPVSR